MGGGSRYSCDISYPEPFRRQRGSGSSGPFLSRAGVPGAHSLPGEGEGWPALAASSPAAASVLCCR